MVSGRSVEPGVTYPRELDPADYDGLPEGWTAIEYAYKSGSSVGKTYVRFNSPVRKDGCSTVKQAVKKAALYRGLSEADADAEALAFEQQHLAKKERIKQEKEASGASKVKKREEAIAAFRAKYGELNGATVCQMPGWRAESLWREACQQLHVTYFNELGSPFVTVKDIEAFLGLRVLQGLECEEVNVARGRVVTDESGKVVNAARLQRNMTLSSDGTEIFANTAGDDLPLLAKKRKRGHDGLALLSLADYVEHASLALLPMLGGSDSSAIEESWAKAGRTAEDLAALRTSAAKIHPLLVCRGFNPEVKLFGLHGMEPNNGHAAALEGIFYEMPGGTHTGRPCFQKVRVSEGVLSCAGLYIFWEQSQQEWRIGSLRDKLVPLAVGMNKGDTPAEPGNRWRVAELEEETKKEPMPKG